MPNASPVTAGQWFPTTPSSGCPSFLFPRPFEIFSRSCQFGFYVAGDHGLPGSAVGVLHFQPSSRPVRQGSSAIVSGNGNATSVGSGIQWGPSGVSGPSPHGLESEQVTGATRSTPRCSMTGAVPCQEPSCHSCWGRASQGGVPRRRAVVVGEPRRLASFPSPSPSPPRARLIHKHPSRRSRASGGPPGWPPPGSRHPVFRGCARRASPPSAWPNPESSRSRRWSFPH